MNHAQIICLINAFLWTWKAAYKTGEVTGPCGDEDFITLYIYIGFFCVSLWGAFG